MSDSDPLKVSNDNKPSDFDPIMGKLFGGLNVKLLLLLYLLFIFLTSDVFMDKILRNIGHETVADQSTITTTTYGSAIQGILLVLFYIVIDILIKKNII